MKFGSSPPPPPDDAADPLLAALRQRLGDYGQAPPPGAWAAIRQQLGPAASPRPWWRRPRRLLPLLGVLLGWLLPSLLGEPLRQASLPTWSVGSPLATQPHGRPVATPTVGDYAGPTRHLPLAEVSGWRPAAPLYAPHRAKASRGTADKAATTPLTQANGRPLATIAVPKAAERPSTRVLTSAKELPTAASAALPTAPATQVRHRPDGLVVADSNRRVPVKSRLSSSLSAKKYPAAHSTATTKALVAVGTSLALPGRRQASARTSISRQATSAGYPEANRQAMANRLTLKGQSISPVRLAARPQSSRLGRRSPVQMVAKTASELAGTNASETTRLLAGHAHSTLLEPADSLALKQTSLLLPAPVLFTRLAARPDSATLAPHPARRWSLLVVAGPTLSYRTLGPAPTLPAGHPDFARLERPALGLGAQVQVRRVLSGRWALAVGVGYHEYATRLALSLKDSTASVHQRDTYRLLTVPVQLSYAWGAPTGRLTKALLLGTEPGWYLGGRSTEGADCGCHQQAYSATGSPYRTWSLAFSLGLDLRYRVGGADSRWQWLVQPTARYVATPFVRSDAVGFTRRQPFSLGLMTGFSWDVH